MYAGSAIERDLEALAERLRASTVAVRLGRGGAGSGVIWGSDGAIVTNAHVANRPVAEVVLSDGRSLRARVGRGEERRDLAQLRVDATGMPPAVPPAPHDVAPGQVPVRARHRQRIRNET